MGYLGNHLATVTVSVFAAILTGFYFVSPPDIHFIMILAVVITWFLAFICWIAQKSADYAHKYGQRHGSDEKKSSISITTSGVSSDDLTSYKASFTNELDQLKDQVKLKDEEISKLRQQIANLETRVQIEALKAELANLKTLAEKEKTSKRKRT